jgi:hypothetical protein
VSYLREDTCRRGVPLRRLWTAEEARTVKAFINNLRVQIWNLPYTEVDADNAVIYIPQGGGGGGIAVFNGRAFDPAGNLTDGLTDASKPWVLYRLDTGAITEQEGPPASPWGANETWRKKSDVAGAIYF